MFLKLFKQCPPRKRPPVPNWKLTALFNGPKSDHCLALSRCQSVTLCFEFCSICWICQSCYIDFFKLLHGFVVVDTRIFLSCYRICQKLYMDSKPLQLKLLQQLFYLQFAFLHLTVLPALSTDSPCCNGGIVN